MSFARPSTRQRSRTTSPAVNSACHTTSTLTAVMHVPGEQARNLMSASTKVAYRRPSSRNPIWGTGNSLTPPPAPVVKRISLLPSAA